jgi:SAM-dependent methyltransferase
MDQIEFSRHFAMLAGSVFELAALGLALEQRAGGLTLSPELQRRVDAVISATGGIPDGLDPLAAGRMSAAAYVSLASARELFGNPMRETYDFYDPKLLAAYGRTSASFANVVASIASQFAGLAERLATQGAQMLDVGVGVAGQAIAFADTFPTLSVTGIDVWQPAIEQAKRNVSERGLENRVEIRCEDVSKIDVIDSFDLIKLPVSFIPETVVRVAIPRLFASLRPGGWLLISTNAGADEKSVALGNLRTVVSGGHVWTPDQLFGLLRDAGFKDERITPLPIGVVFVAAQKPSRVGDA